MRAIGVLGVLVATSSSVVAQPPPPPPSYDRPQPPFRWAVQIGTAGTIVEKTDLGYTLGLQVSHTAPVAGPVSFGWQGGLHLRNWQVIEDTYDTILSCDCAEVPLGILFGWLSGTGLINVGWHIMARGSGDNAAWALLGSDLFLAIDSREVRDEVIFGHASHYAIGYDFTDDIGIGVHVLWAPSDSYIFDTTGPSYFSMTASIEIRRWGRTKRPH